MELRSLAIGLSLLTAGTVIGVTTQQFASAEISAGDRPVLVPIEPCRLVDTRPGNATVGPRSSPLGAADTLTVDAQQTATTCTGAIPADALSLSLNVTAIGATEQTFLTIWAGGARPNASSLNPAPAAPPTPNAVTVDLSVDQEFQIYNAFGSLNLIVDVNGYYENHNHDDRYPLVGDVYTRPEVDDAIGAAAVEVASATNPGFGSSNASFEAQREFLPLTFTTTRPGRLYLDASYGVRVNCGAGNDAWYYLLLDGEPVESSVTFRGDNLTVVRSYSGQTPTIIPPGEHVVQLGAECRDPDDNVGGSGSLNASSVHVLVIG